MLPEARVVFLVAPLTNETRGMIDLRRLRLMREDACLVDVARGELVVTGDLVRALRENWIACAGLNVTDPEPLPPGHPLREQPRCIITAHSAGDLAGVIAPLADLVEANVRQLHDGLPPHGVVDRTAGY